jgi:MinD-like ATPase involved in chromosome partitioning or flagellar assembly
MWLSGGSDGAVVVLECVGTPKGAVADVLEEDEQIQQVPLQWYPSLPSLVERLEEQEKLKVRWLSR